MGSVSEEPSGGPCRWVQNQFGVSAAEVPNCMLIEVFQLIDHVIPGKQILDAAPGLCAKLQTGRLVIDTPAQSLLEIVHIFVPEQQSGVADDFLVLGNVTGKAGKSVTHRFQQADRAALELGRLNKQSCI